MTDPDLIGLFVGPLERLGLPYMITGGVASVVYGDPRFTRDVDLVVDLRPDGVTPFMETFGGEAFYVPPEETLLEEVGRGEGGHFNVRIRPIGCHQHLSRNVGSSTTASASPFLNWRSHFSEMNLWVGDSRR